MSKSIILFIVLALFILPCIEPFRAQDTDTYPLWNNIEAGPHHVGFKVINYRDESRTPSETARGISFFPIQISVWYPAAEKWSAEKAMPFKEYFYLTEQKNDFKMLSDEQKQKAMDIFFNFTKHGAKIDLTKEEVAGIGNIATAVMKDAKPAGGRFPVIIAGHDGGVWKGTTLNEFLASHGYVVISTGFLSETSGMFLEDPQEVLRRRIRTHEIVREKLTDFAFVDDSKMGLLGINADGMTMLLYQMKNSAADAVVSIDGWEGKNNGYRFVTNNKYYDPDDFRVPLMEFQQHEETDRELLQLNTGIFESLEYSDRFSYVMTDFGHAYLTGNTIAVSELEKPIVKQYKFMYNSILQFYDGYIKSDEGAVKGLWSAPAYNDSFFQRANIKKAKNG